MKYFLKNLKNLIKTEPIILLKKPWLVFLIPMVLFYVFSNRLNSSLTKVYLTESFVDSLLRPDTVTLDGDNKLKIVRSFVDFIEYAQQRILEEVDQADSLIKVIRKRFEKGDFAIVYTEKSGNPLSYVFIGVSLADITPVGITLKIPQKTFGMYDVYTFKESRGEGHYSCLFNYAVGYMKNRGYEKMWLWLMKQNEVSVKVHYKLGIRKIVKVMTERLRAGIITRKTEDVDMLLAELIAHE
ncbi:MAG: GNAT family N-acetyltransferase [Bacteroidales bacterium]